MYAYIKGIVAELGTQEAVIENNGIGYSLLCSSTCLNSIKLNQEVKIYTYQHVREDAVILFGFISKEERTMFLRLISVSGIGPKIALQILSVLSPGDLAIILVSGDSSALTKVPGVGKKTAQRLILELREKVENEELTAAAGTPSASLINSSVISDAVYALAALGYSSQEATKAVEAVAAQCKDTEEIIRSVLRSFDRR